MVAALITELQMRAEANQQLQFSTIYFGGGTPSLLTIDAINALFKTIEQNYQIVKEPEVTLEANPDDLTTDKVLSLQDSTVNRLSIGIQSFDDEILSWMNRAHTAAEARRCLSAVRQAGFEAISVDLIYGIPGLTAESWMEQLEILASFCPPHLSCYGLTVEDRTALAHWVRTGRVKMPQDAHVVEQFYQLLDWSETNEYDHYEISNFAREGNYALHNSNYWRGIPYVGVGPGAHSFDGIRRSWNVAHNHKYVESIKIGALPCKSEELTDAIRYNEWVMTSLRTKWGCDVSHIRSIQSHFYDHFMSEIQAHVSNGFVTQEQERFYLTRSGKVFADRITTDLFYVE